MRTMSIAELRTLTLKLPTATPLISPLRVSIVLLSLWHFAFSAVLNAQDPTPPPRPASLCDTSPTLADFPKELACNFRRLWSKDNLRPFLVGVAATAAAIPADSHVAGYFEDTSRLRNFDTVGIQIGRAYVLGSAIGGLFLTSRATGNNRFRQASYSLAQGLVLNEAMTGGIKVLTRRERPDHSNRLSFPSGHTSNSFMWATVLSHYYGKKAAIPAYAVAAYVGASRLKTRKHYLTDIIAGATFGYIVGRTVTKGAEKSRNRRFNWGVTVPPGGGAAVILEIRPR